MAYSMHQCDLYLSKLEVRCQVAGNEMIKFSEIFSFRIKQNFSFFYHLLALTFRLHGQENAHYECHQSSLEKLVIFPHALIFW